MLGYRVQDVRLGVLAVVHGDRLVGWPALKRRMKIRHIGRG